MVGRGDGGPAVGDRRGAAPSALAARYQLNDELAARLAGIDAITDAVIEG